MKNNIILIGYMGCGKSTIGKLLAGQEGVEFLDTDAIIEEKEGMTISRLFEEKGEPYFRDLETVCIKELLAEEEKNKDQNTKRKVISVGGGLPVKKENAELLRQLGEVIYLRAVPETLYERLKGDASRPLLQTQNLKNKIQEMLQEREEKYLSAAHRVIEADGKSVSCVAEEILQYDLEKIGSGTKYYNE